MNNRRDALKEVIILGTKYKIEFLTKKQWAKEYKETAAELEGFCYCYEKKIHVLTDKRSKEHINSILRHEIIHAFQNESGVRYAMDYNWDKESETDWLAYQLPKISEVFKELNI